MKISKKIVSVFTAAVLAANLIGCSSDNSSSVEYTVGICQSYEDETLDTATQGFKDALTEKLGKDKVAFDEQNAQGEATECSTICNKFVTNKVDLILGNATDALQAAAQATEDIPILGTSIIDYGTTLNIEDWTGKTGTNVSGTSDLAPIEQQKDMIFELLPDTKKVGILYCASESDSAYQSDLMKKALEKDNIEYKEYIAANSNDIESITLTACDECDVLYIPADNTMASSVETIQNITLPAGVPMIAGGKTVCAAGIATLSIDYYSLGYQTGKMAYEILKNGKKPEDMEIEFSEKITKMYNEENCRALNISIPDDYEKLSSESDS